MPDSLITPLSELWGQVRGGAMRGDRSGVIVEFEDGELEWLPLDEISVHDHDNARPGNAVVAFCGYHDRIGSRTRFWVTWFAAEPINGAEERKRFLYCRLTESYGLAGPAGLPEALPLPPASTDSSSFPWGSEIGNLAANRRPGQSDTSLSWNI